MPSAKSGKSKTPKEPKGDKQPDIDNFITYELSDPKYIEMGWTMLSMDEEKEQLVTYHAEPSKIHNVWLEERLQQEKRYYKNGELFLLFRTNGTGRVLYPDGQLAIKVSKHESGTRMIVLNPSGKDETGVYRQKSLAAMFDSFGNGIIYDLSGKVRLKYSQKEGILFDTPNGLPVPWKWKVATEIKKIVAAKEAMNKCHKIPADIVERARYLFEMREKEREKKPVKEVHSAKETPTSQVQIMTKASSVVASKKSAVSQRSVIKPASTVSVDDVKTPLENPASTSGNLQVTSQETRQFVPQDNKPLPTRKKLMFSTEKCTPVKIIVLQINKYIGFRILDQSNISLQFVAGNKVLRLELGVRVNPHIEVSVNEVNKNTIPLKDIPCVFEVSRTPSMIWTHSLLLSHQKKAKKGQQEKDVPEPLQTS